jgi:hypothetical protein
MKFISFSLMLPTAVFVSHISAQQTISFSCQRGEGSSACIVPNFENSPCSSVYGSLAGCANGDTDCSECILRDNGGSVFQAATGKLSSWCLTKNGSLGLSKVGDVVCSSQNPSR